MLKNEFIKKWCELEGGKSQVAVGNAREMKSKFEIIIANNAMERGSEKIELGDIPQTILVEAQKKLDKLLKKRKK